MELFLDAAFAKEFPGPWVDVRACGWVYEGNRSYEELQQVP